MFVFLNETKISWKISFFNLNLEFLLLTSVFFQLMKVITKINSNLWGGS